MGDINIDFKSDPCIATKLNNLMIDSGFKQIVKKPTRITNTSSTLVDWITVNNYSLKELPRKFPKMSDHSMIGLEITY